MSGSQGVANQYPGCIFLSMMNRVFQIEDHGIGAVQGGVYEIFRLVTGQIEARTPQPVASEGCRQKKPLRAAPIFLWPVQQYVLVQ